MTREELIRKYDVPVPRYTSYPTVPCWDSTGFDGSKWRQAVVKCFDETNVTKGTSLYVHLPYCESLCTYCACNTRITRNHAVEGKYISGVLQEWDAYKDWFSTRPSIRELHLGGGTPTFFSPANLSLLVSSLLEGASIHPQHEFSFEGHPNNTTAEHLKVLWDHEFRRVSFGVQDLDEKVQRAINRIQPLENLKKATEDARRQGYTSVSFDLIYGLPYQTRASVVDTISKVIGLRPDRIAFYSYAHVPWIKPGQRGYEDADLPSDTVKRSLYEIGRELFLKAGYIDIGMDHFSLSGDALAVAHKTGRLHRNFMGYTTSETDLLLGLGTSAISDAKYAYAQNEKKVETYLEKVRDGQPGIFKGHMQREDDLLLRRLILDIVCRGEASFRDYPGVVTKRIFTELDVMKEEGLVDFNLNTLRVTESGKPFIRNIASVFDARLRERSEVTKPLFSKAI